MFWFILSIISIIAGLVMYFFLFADGNKKFRLSVLVCSVALSCLLLFLSVINSVPTGHTGVVTIFGRVENYTLDSGVHFLAPWAKVIKMDNRIQKETIQLSCFSADIQEVSMVYTVNYQIDKVNAMTIYRTIGKDYYKKIIVPAITESVKIVTARYTAEQLVGSRNVLASAIEEDVDGKLLAYNIKVESTSIEDMDFTDAFTQAVEAKQVAAQNKLKAETEAQQRVVEANAQAEIQKINAEANAYEATTKAKADAEVVSIKAKAEADAIKVKADAESEANKKIADSLTSELIEYTYANGWDGKLPEFMNGNNGNGVFPVVGLN